MGNNDHHDDDDAVKKSKKKKKKKKKKEKREKRKEANVRIGLMMGPEHGRYPEGILRAALECLGIGFEPDRSKWLTKPDLEPWWEEN